MTRSRLTRLAAVALALTLLAGCESMYALEHALQQNAKNHPGGEVGFGLDAALSGLAAQQAAPRRR